MRVIKLTIESLDDDGSHMETETRTWESSDTEWIIQRMNAYLHACSIAKENVPFKRYKKRVE